MTTKELVDELSQGIIRRPKVYVRNPRYPKVTAKDCYFNESSGGFDLIHMKTNKYLVYYTKADIAKPEKKYARGKPRKRKGLTPLST
jgi:hypothetical protein